MAEQSEQHIDWILWYPAEVTEDVRLPTGEHISSSRLPLSSKWLNIAWHRAGIPVKIDRHIGFPDVVHGTDFVVPPSACPSVVSVFDLSYALFPEFAHPKLKKYLERAVPRSMDRAKKIITISESSKRDLCEYYEISPNRVTVIHPAADPMFKPPTESDILAMQAQLGLKRPYFITVGTVEPRKDHLTLIRAFTEFHHDHPDVSLVIVGRNGWLSDPIMKAINEASETMPIRHLQGINDQLLPALYAGSLGLVYPSQYEGFGLPLVEAMACDTPVIASSTSVHIEVAGDAALYAPVTDSSRLAEHMHELASNERARQDLVHRGRNRASSFSWTTAAQQHIAVYWEVAG
jgi:glycosyltransferase involved in cell wall biosynthesis